jgi:hypothetical protein
LDITFSKSAAPMPTWAVVISIGSTQMIEKIPRQAVGKSRALSDTSTPHCMSRLFSRKKAGPRRDAIRSQVIDMLEAQIKKKTGNEEE